MLGNTVDRNHNETHVILVTYNRTSSHLWVCQKLVVMTTGQAIRERQSEFVVLHFNKRGQVNSTLLWRTVILHGYIW